MGRRKAGKGRGEGKEAGRGVGRWREEGDGGGEWRRRRKEAGGLRGREEERRERCIYCLKQKYYEKKLYERKGVNKKFDKRTKWDWFF